MAKELKTGPEKWTTSGLLTEMLKIHKERKDRQFAFILGAGASITSGIPAARKMAVQWLHELQRLRDDEYDIRSVEEWIKVTDLGIPDFNFDKVEEYYPTIYDLRFAHDQDEGQAFLESVMTKDEVSPGVGYSILAQILAGSQHKVVITPNFDHLVSNALLLYTGKEPFVVGHEELAGFIRINMRRPLIAKIHRDLLLGPQSSTKDLTSLHHSWVDALRKLFAIYTPIVIGYGGNDGTLMGLLSEMNPEDIAGRMIWCHLEQDPPRENVTDTLRNLGGVLVPILGFDEFMLQLGHVLELPVVAQQLEEVAHRRGQVLLKQLGGIRQRLIKMSHGDKGREAQKVLDAFDQSINYQVEKLPDWWAWEIKANSEPFPDEKVAIYKKAIAEISHSPELLAGYAKALLAINSRDMAVKSMERAYSLDRTFSHDLAWILSETFDPDEERIISLFEEAIKTHPNNPDVNADFAEYYSKIGRSRKAAEHFKMALELNPKRTETLIRYSVYEINQGKYKSAGKLARRAWFSCVKKDNFNAIKTILLLSIIDTLEGGDGMTALARLKSLFISGYENAYQVISNWIPYNASRLQVLIADALTDGNKLEELNNDQEWIDIEPISPDEPWFEDEENEEEINDPNL